MSINKCIYCFLGANNLGSYFVEFLILGMEIACRLSTFIKICIIFYPVFIRRSGQVYAKEVMNFERLCFWFFGGTFIYLGIYWTFRYFGTIKWDVSLGFFYWLWINYFFRSRTVFCIICGFLFGFRVRFCSRSRGCNRF